MTCNARVPCNHSGKRIISLHFLAFVARNVQAKPRLWQGQANQGDSCLTDSVPRERSCACPLALLGLVYQSLVTGTPPYVDYDANTTVKQCVCRLNNQCSRHVGRVWDTSNMYSSCSHLHCHMSPFVLYSEESPVMGLCNPPLRRASGIPSRLEWSDSHCIKG